MQPFSVLEKAIAIAFVDSMWSTRQYRRKRIPFIATFNGRKRVNQLHKIISNRNINLSARRHLLLSGIRPSIEYGSEVWEGNKSQAGSLESIILDGAKWILGCSSKTCNEAV